MSERYQRVPIGTPEGMEVRRLRKMTALNLEPVYQAELAPISEPAEPEPEYHESEPMSPELAAVNRRMFNSILTARIPEENIEHAEAEVTDTMRLDWLERRRLALNTHYGTRYGWKFVANHNVTRLFVHDVVTIDLHDSEAKAGNIREAIDHAMKETK